MREPLHLNYNDDDRLTSRLAYVSSVYDRWWKSWYDQVLPTLVPCKKWKFPAKNLEKDDIVFMHYPSAMKDHYRLARVIETFPDKSSKKLVRTVKVCYRKRDAREPIEQYKVKPLTEEIVAVQRLSLLLPKSERSH